MILIIICKEKVNKLVNILGLSPRSLGNNYIQITCLEFGLPRFEARMWDAIILIEIQPSKTEMKSLICHSRRMYELKGMINE